MEAAAHDTCVINRKTNTGRSKHGIWHEEFEESLQPSDLVFEIDAFPLHDPLRLACKRSEVITFDAFHVDPTEPTRLQD